MALTKAKLIADGVIDVDNLAAGHSITTSNIGEGSNLYYTDGRVASYLTTNSYATESFVTTGYLPLSGGTVSGNLTVTGSLTGTLATSAQTNITSLGTLSSLAVSGDVSIADKIIHTGDTNTAIRFPAADTVTIETAGTERLRVDSSGNVGIGTSSPQEKLDVSGGSIGASKITGRSYTITVTSVNPNKVTGSGFLSVPVQVGDVITFPFSQVRTVTAVTDTQITVTSSWSISFGGSAATGEGGLGFNTSNTERMRITSGGDVNITSGNLSFANGSGIDFSATEGGGASSSLLDDYEEGTWTPAFTFATEGDLSVSYNIEVNTAFYTKIGRVVTLTFMLRTLTFTHTTASGSLLLTGLPFTAINYAQAGGSAPGSSAALMEFGGTTETVRLNVIKNNTTCSFSKNDLSGSLTAADVTTENVVDLRITLTYHSA